jgi:glutamate/aspartate transport system substrate-binding protein
MRWTMSAAAVFGVCFALPAAAQQIDAIVNKLNSTHTITMGYRETILPTSYLDENKKPTGYAVEMCLRIFEDVKKELGLPEIKVNYVPVNIQNRQALVANGTVDIECGGTVNTFGRSKQVDFSPVTYVAASQLLALKTSGISTFDDLNGKIVAVASGGSNEPELQDIIKEHHLNLKVLNVNEHAAALLAIESRRADAYYSDNSAFFSLIKQAKEPDKLAIVGPEYGYQPQGFMVPKNNPTFLWMVDKSMGHMFKSGEAKKLFDKWFGPFGQTVGPKLKAAWETYSFPD